MRSIKASEFKAKCLKLMDEVAESGEPLVITKNGRPLAKLAPLTRGTRSILGLHEGQVEILGDIISPVELDKEEAEEEREEGR